KRGAASSARRGQTLEAAGVGSERGGNCDRAVGVLVVFQHGDEGAADGEAGAVERMDEFRLAATLGLVADVRAPAAEVGVGRAGRDFAILVLPGQPYL